MYIKPTTFAISDSSSGSKSASTSKRLSTGTMGATSTKKSIHLLPPTINIPIDLPDEALTLNCLVHGEPIDCYFEITAKKDDDVRNLKELIMIETGVDKKTARQLRLWVVSVPFDSNNLGNPNIDITNVLNGQRFLPPRSVGDMFTQQLAENHIHIIVEMPVSAGK
jgi:hypothetical protein